MKNKFIVPFIISIIDLVVDLGATVHQIIKGNAGFAILCLFVTVLCSMWFGISLTIVIIENGNIKYRKRRRKFLEKFMKDQRENQEDPFEEFEEEFVGGENDKGT